MKKIFLILLVIIALGCSKEAKIPDDVLSKEKMVELLIDIHLLEEKIEYLRLEKDTSLMLYKAYEYELLKEHKVDTAVYQRSYHYYATEVRAMVDIYEAVVDSLNVRNKKVVDKSKVDEEGEPVKTKRRKSSRKVQPKQEKEKEENE